MAFLFLDYPATSPEDEVLKAAMLLDCTMDVEYAVVLSILAKESSHASFAHITSNLWVGPTDNLLDFYSSQRSSNYND